MYATVGVLCYESEIEPLDVLCATISSDKYLKRNLHITVGKR